MANHFLNPRTNICTRGAITKAIRAQGTPSSPPFSAGPFGAARRGPGHCQDSERCGSVRRCRSSREQAATRARAGAFTRPNSCQGGIELQHPASLCSPCGSPAQGQAVLCCCSPEQELRQQHASYGMTFSLLFFLFFPPRFLLLPSKMPTSSYRLTMPGWQLTTSEPSKCNASRSSWKEGGKSQPV